MKKKQKTLIRVLAIVLAALLAIGAIVSAVISIASAEELPSENNSYAMTIEYMENEQALRISQRLVYINKTGEHLDRVVFYASANMFRRQSALMYESDALTDCFPYGYVPGGIELISVCVNDAAADYGFQGEDELYLRVACDLEPGETATFAFEYYLLLTENHAFLGIDDFDVRLSDFYLICADYDETYHEFILNAPLAHTRYIDTDPADYTVDIALPDTFNLVSTGIKEKETEGHTVRWHVEQTGARAFQMSFGKRYRETAGSTESGVRIRCLTNVRGAASEVISCATRAIELYEEWFGTFPVDTIDIAQAGIGTDCVIGSGCIWISEEVLAGDRDELRHILYRALAQQYFGLACTGRPVSDAWLSDSICEYIAYLVTEETRGHDAYLAELNERVVPSLQLTIPGGLSVTTEASLFDEGEYDIIVRNRGAAVFHELSVAMGREELIAGLRAFYRQGCSVHRLTEMDLVDALDSVNGGSWESFLTDWLFNIGDYVDQTIDWLD